MSNLIERLKQKPDHHKRTIALSVSAGVTLVIFAVWISTFFVGNSPGIVAATDSRQDLITPLNNLKNGVAQAYQGFENSVTLLREQFAQPK